MQLERLTAFLDRELAIDRFQDSSHNGLQVANSGRVTRVALGVDATLPFFEQAAAAGADLAICHHGLSWGDSLKRLTGLNYRLVSCLMRHNLALWACHLPLDAHPRLGNNAQLARALGLRGLKPFSTYHGQMIGMRGALPRAMPRRAFAVRVRQATGSEARMLDFGAPVVRTVGVVSGGAAAQVVDAVAAGLDAFVTGEPTLSGYNLALQEKMNVAYAGHYATERFGVQAVGALLRRRFGLPVQFMDMGIAY